MKKVARYALVMIALFMCLTMVVPSKAGAAHWSQVASTCVVDENTQGKYQFLGAVFQFLPNAVSTLNWLGLPLPMTLRCHVQNPHAEGNPAWSSMAVTYQDSDGPGDNARLVVKLIKMARVDGGFETVAVFDSDQYPATTGRFIDQMVRFDNNKIDFSHNNYVISADLYRRTIASNPRLMRVHLDEY